MNVAAASSFSFHLGFPFLLFLNKQKFVEGSRGGKKESSANINKENNSRKSRLKSFFFLSPPWLLSCFWLQILLFSIFFFSIFRWHEGFFLSCHHLLAFLSTLLVIKGLFFCAACLGPDFFQSLNSHHFSVCVTFVLFRRPKNGENKTFVNKKEPCNFLFFHFEAKQGAIM